MRKRVVFQALGYILYLTYFMLYNMFEFLRFNCTPLQCFYLFSTTSLRNKGMKHLIGPDWRDLFDVIITNARKPKFFSDIQRYDVIFIDIKVS